MSATSATNNSVLSCDLCGNRQIFLTKQELDEHAAQRHKGFVQDGAALLEMANIIAPHYPAVLNEVRGRYQAIGRLSYELARRRDAGRDRLRQACDARAQLEAIVQSWRPGCRVYMFGSSVVMGFWDGLSDIDFTVVDFDAIRRGEWPPDEKAAVVKLSRSLLGVGFTMQNLNPIRHARVPIIKHEASEAVAGSVTALAPKRTGLSFHLLKPEHQSLLARTVVFQFDSVVAADARPSVERSIVDAAVPIVKPPPSMEAPTASAPSNTEACSSGVASSSSNAATTTTNAPPVDDGPPPPKNGDGGVSATAAAAVVPSGQSTSCPNHPGSGALHASQPPEQMWWDQGGTRLCITFRTPTDAMVALVRGRQRVLSQLRRAGPIHAIYRPQLFGIDFDLSFRVFGIRNSFLLRQYLTSHPCGRPGALVLKDWSKAAGVNDSMHGLLTSYAINILWIYFLVTKEHVAYVDPKSIPENVTPATDPDPPYNELFDPNLSEAAKGQLYEQMGQLLLEFFAFYALEFDWNANVVSLNRPGVTPKAAIGWLSTQETLLSKHPGKNVRYSMCIEDPYEDDLNLGRHLGVNRSAKLMAEFRRGFISLLRDNPEDSCVFPGKANVGAASAATLEHEERQPDVSHLATLMVHVADFIEKRRSHTALRGASTTTTEEEGRDTNVHPAVGGGGKAPAGAAAASLKAWPEVTGPQLWEHLQSTEATRVALAAVMRHWSMLELLNCLGYRCDTDGKLLPQRVISAKAARRVAVLLAKSPTATVGHAPATTAAAASTSSSSLSLRSMPPLAAARSVPSLGWTPEQAQFLTQVSSSSRHYAVWSSSSPASIGAVATFLRWPPSILTGVTVATWWPPRQPRSTLVAPRGVTLLSGGFVAKMIAAMTTRRPRR